MKNLIKSYIGVGLGTGLSLIVMLETLNVWSSVRDKFPRNRSKVAKSSEEENN